MSLYSRKSKSSNLSRNYIRRKTKGGKTKSNRIIRKRQYGGDAGDGNSGSSKWWENRKEPYINKSEEFSLNYNNNGTLDPIPDFDDWGRGSDKINLLTAILILISSKYRVQRNFEGDTPKPTIKVMLNAEDQETKLQIDWDIYGIGTIDTDTYTSDDIEKIIDPEQNLDFIPDKQAPSYPTDYNIIKEATLRRKGLPYIFSQRQFQLIKRLGGGDSKVVYRLLRKENGKTKGSEDIITKTTIQKDGKEFKINYGNGKMDTLICASSGEAGEWEEAINKAIRELSNQKDTDVNSSQIKLNKSFSEIEAENQGLTQNSMLVEKDTSSIKNDFNDFGPQSDININITKQIKIPSKKKLKHKIEYFRKIAKLILYVKTYIHPRWILLTNYNSTDKTSTISINPWNSYTYKQGEKKRHDGEAGHDTLLGYRGDDRKWVEGLLDDPEEFYNKITNVQEGDKVEDDDGAQQKGEVVNIYIDSTNSVVHFKVDLQGKKINFMPAVKRNGSLVVEEGKGPANTFQRTSDGVKILHPAKEDFISILNERDFCSQQKCKYLSGKDEYKGKYLNCLIDCRENNIIGNFKDIDTMKQKGYMGTSKRPVCFFGPFDLTITQGKDFFVNSHYNMMNNLDENSDYKLYDKWAEIEEKNTYQDMCYTNMAIVAQKTKFFNRADRGAAGILDSKYNEQNLEAHLLFTTGFRGELPGTPEYKLFTNIDGSLNENKYKKRLNIIFNMVYKYIHEYKTSTSPIMVMTGLGLGVWELKNSKQKEIFIKEFGDFVKKKKQEARYLHWDGKKITDDIDRNGDIVYTSENNYTPKIEEKEKNPGDLVTNKEKEYFFVFAGDSNSFRGNEGVIGCNTMSGDPQFVVNSEMTFDWEGAEDKFDYSTPIEIEGEKRKEEGQTTNKGEEGGGEKITIKKENLMEGRSGLTLLRSRENKVNVKNKNSNFEEKMEKGKTFKLIKIDEDQIQDFDSGVDTIQKKINELKEGTLDFFTITVKEINEQESVGGRKKYKRSKKKRIHSINKQKSKIKKSQSRRTNKNKRRQTRRR
jgi:hypothetical protein